MPSLPQRIKDLVHVLWTVQNEVGSDMPWLDLYAPIEVRFVDWAS